MPAEDNKQAARRFYQEVINVIVEGDLVAARVTYTGTHQGEFVGIPATGKQTTTNGVDFFRMQDGRQAEHWGGPDMFSFLMQLGVMPGPGTPGPGTPA
jgi:predicted ester cyclase